MKKLQRKVIIQLQHDINSFGMQINAAYDARSIRRINKLKEEANTLLERLNDKVPLSTKAHLHHNLGNLWGFRIAREVWHWENVARTNEIINFRKAAKFSEGDTNITDGIKSAIHVNLANAFSAVGRFVVAQQYWNEALKNNPKFGMAWANKGYGLCSYSQAMYDPNQRRHFLIEARDCIKKALKCKQYPIEAHSLDFFMKLYSSLDKETKNKKHNFRKFNKGADRQEAKYIEWCLEQRLYLNPLNDITKKNVAAHDVVSFPTVMVPAQHGPYFFSMFDHIKQEFSTARTMLYEGLCVDESEYLYTGKEERHYSDRNLDLYNTWDGAQLNFGIEKQKIAFRTFYSLLDKVSWLLNTYMKVEANRKNNIYIRTIWYKNLDKSQGISSKFKRRKNWPLRGLYWLSKDIFERKTNKKTTLPNENYLYPEAQELDEIRNWLEHKSVKIISDNSFNPGKKKQWHGADTLVITQEEFREKTLWLAHICREAIIYLSLGIHHEERMRERRKASKKEGLIFSQSLPHL